MSLSLKIDLGDLRGGDPRLARIRRAAQNRRALHMAMASTVSAERVQPRFRELAATNRNPFGARGGFWNRMLAGTRARADQRGAYVDMPREVAQRAFGGTLRPTGGKKYLPIPARTEAYGKSPREFDNLRFVPFKSGAKALVQRVELKVIRHKSGRKKGTIKEIQEIGGAGVLYWLVTSVTQRGQRDVLPSAAEILDASIHGAAIYLNRAATGGPK